MSGKLLTGASLACAAICLVLCSLVAPGGGEFAAFEELKIGPFETGRAAVPGAVGFAGLAEIHPSDHFQSQADPGQTDLAQAALVESLEDGQPSLRQAFNADRGKVRLLLILSPT